MPLVAVKLLLDSESNRLGLYEELSENLSSLMALSGGMLATALSAPAAAPSSPFVSSTLATAFGAGSSTTKH